MTVHTDNPNRIRIDQIKARLGAISADRWSYVFDDAGERIIATRVVFDGDGKRAGDEAPAELCRFGPDAAWHEKEFVREAREDMRFLLDQLDWAGRAIRDLRSQVRRFGSDEKSAGRIGNLAAEASMKCGEPAFQRFLAERHATDDDGDLADSAVAAAVLRRALTIESRKQLNTDPDAAARWRDMRADFQAWGRGDAS